MKVCLGLNSSSVIMCISKKDAEDYVCCSGTVSLVALLLLIPGIALVSVYPSNYSIKETALVKSTCVRSGQCIPSGKYYIGYSPEYDVNMSTSCSKDFNNRLVPDSECPAGVRMYYYKYRFPADVNPMFVPYPVVDLFITGCIFVTLAGIPILITLISLIVWLSYPSVRATAT